MKKAFLIALALLGALFLFGCEINESTTAPPMEEPIDPGPSDVTLSVLGQCVSSASGSFVISCSDDSSPQDQCRDVVWRAFKDGDELASASSTCGASESLDVRNGGVGTYLVLQRVNNLAGRPFETRHEVVLGL